MDSSAASSIEFACDDEYERLQTWQCHNLIISDVYSATNSNQNSMALLTCACTTYGSMWKTYFAYFALNQIQAERARHIWRPSEQSFCLLSVSAGSSSLQIFFTAWDRHVLLVNYTLVNGQYYRGHIVTLFSRGQFAVVIVDLGALPALQTLDTGAFTVSGCISSEKLSSLIIRGHERQLDVTLGKLPALHELIMECNYHEGKVSCIAFGP